MESSLIRNWWLLALCGALAFVFGVLVVFLPQLAWIVLVAGFAAHALVDGVFAISLAFAGYGQGRRWWALILQGVIGIAVAAIALFAPGVAQLFLLALIAAWALVTGMFRIVTAIRLRKEIEGEWTLILSGILSVIFGAAIIILPAAGALAIAWIVAAYSIVFGVLMVGLAFRLRSVARHAPRVGSFTMSR